ncbi:zinc-dependent metalloprotease [uncultured Butyricimonas sp.]|uniref:zinc-dependent metalloprotease n=1 Tax=uncultured Butyricimonas sp. TaxID=1268785 RepID=UPI0026DC20AE|nr:zinc-dependent metalloprotease [uncultured Butyricimonas sp.]
MKNCMILIWIVLLLLPTYYGVLANGRAQYQSVASSRTDKKENVKKKKNTPKKKSAKNSTIASSNFSTAARKTDTPYQKVFKDKSVETVKSDFMTIHKVDGKLYFEIPLKQMGLEMLLSAAASQTSNSTFADMGLKKMLHVKFTIEDSLVYLRMVNKTTTYDTKEHNIVPAIQDNTLDAVLESYKMVGLNADKTAVLIDVTKFFMETNDNLNLFRKKYSLFSIYGKSKMGSAVVKSMKTFDDNLTIKVLMPHTVKLLLMGMTYAQEDVTVMATYSLVLLPKESMRPRISDSRVGVFLTNKEHFTMEQDGVEHYSMAYRWRLEPKDVEAYKRGELVEPKKPIVWYVDSAFPEEWKEPIRRAVLRWNPSFEKIGFKNVLQVRDFPKDDPSFDPENVKYSCIRYLPTGIANAMGPCFVDQKTGEIFGASVLVYSNVVQMINNWRFIQTAQIDPSVRNKKMPQEIMDESIEYVIAHEIGHTLGFMHNMAASAAYPVDSLRSATFTQRYGTTPSIMDYARFNYVAQPGDKGVKLTPPTLGVYDDFLVQWDYQYFPDAKDMKEEAIILEKMVDAKAGDPMYRYGRQQIASRYDPSALEEDLGDDPMKAGDYGIKNLKYILSNLDKWIKDDADGSHKNSLYRGLANQYYRYLKNVSYNIGGIYLTEVKEGTPGQRFVAVPKAKQKASLKWLINHFRDSDWLNNKELTRKFPLGINMGAITQKALASSIPNLYKGVILSSHVSQDPYTEQEFFNDLYNLVFENTIKNNTLTDADKMLQMTIIDWIAQTFTVAPAGKGLLGIISEEDAYAPSLEDIAAYGLDETGITNHFFDQIRLMREKQGNMITAEELTNFGYSYGWQNNVNITAIDNSRTYIFALGTRVRQLLENKLSTAKGADRTHYEILLFTLNQKLKNL